MTRLEMLVDNAIDLEIALFEKLGNLGSRKYVMKFRRETTCIYCFELDQWISPEDFIVDESWYFEEKGNPDTARILYAISLTNGMKGFLIDTCDVYTDNISREMAIKFHLHDDSDLQTSIADYIERVKKHTNVLLQS